MKQTSLIGIQLFRLVASAFVIQNNEESTKSKGLSDIVANLAGKFFWFRYEKYICCIMQRQRFSSWWLTWTIFLGIGNTELSVISDFEAPQDEQVEFFNGLNEKGILYNSFSVDSLRWV